MPKSQNRRKQTRSQAASRVQAKKVLTPLREAEREIAVAHKARLAHHRQLSEEWLPYMTPMFLAGWASTLVMILAGVAKGAAGAALMGVASAVVNAAAGYAIYKGGQVQPERSPVVYRADIGTLRGVPIAVTLALLGLLVAFLAAQQYYGS